MKEKDYKEWIEKFLLDKDLKLKKYFFEILSFKKNLIKNSGSDFSYDVGISFNSIKNLSSIKCSYLFTSSLLYKNKSLKHLFNEEVIVKYIEKINKIFNTHFNITILKKLFSIPLTWSYGYGSFFVIFSVGLSFEFDFQFNRFEKISFYFLPESKEKIKEIGEFLNIKKENLNLKFLNLRLSSIGVTLYSNGESSLKVYQKVLPGRVIIMTRFFKDLKVDNNVYFNPDFLNKIQSDFYKKYAFFKEYENFLKEITLYINGFEIEWISFKRTFEGKKFIEIYFL